MGKTDPPPRVLIEAFKAAGAITDIAVLMSDEGFDPIAIRVLGAFEKAPGSWTRPRKPCPDDGRPTVAAWAWLMSGWWIDVAAIAVGANISRDRARESMDTLRQARLVFPDGSISKEAKSAMQAAVASRLMAAGARAEKPKKKDDKKPDDNAN